MISPLTPLGLVDLVLSTTEMKNALGSGNRRSSALKVVLLIPHPPLLHPLVINTDHLPDQVFNPPSPLSTVGGKNQKPGTGQLYRLSVTTITSTYKVKLPSASTDQPKVSTDSEAEWCTRLITPNMTIVVSSDTAAITANMDSTLGLGVFLRTNEVTGVYR